MTAHSAGYSQRVGTYCSLDTCSGFELKPTTGLVLTGTPKRRRTHGYCSSVAATGMEIPNRTNARAIQCSTVLYSTVLRARNFCPESSSQEIQLETTRGGGWAEHLMVVVVTTVEAWKHGSATLYQIDRHPRAHLPEAAGVHFSGYCKIA